MIRRGVARSEPRIAEAVSRLGATIHQVIPLSEPELDAAPVAAGEAFAFTMTFDVAPEIELKPFDELSIEKESWIADDATVSRIVLNGRRGSLSIESH